MSDFNYLSVFKSDSFDPFYNLALESYFFDLYSERSKNDKSPILFLWQNEPSVIIGRNQNPYNECNLNFLRDNNIKLCRRITGGGAVYHDKGNLNFSLIHSQCSESYKALLFPIMKSIGENLDISFSGRNDLVINNKKISGTAYYNRDGNCLLHGCILIKRENDNMTRALTPKRLKLEKNGIESVVSRVCYLSDFINEIDVDYISNKIISEYQNYFSVQNLNFLTNSEFFIDDLIQKFKSETWIFSDFQNCESFFEKKFDWGILSIGFNTKDNEKKICSIESDSLDIDDIKIMKEVLKKDKVQMFYDIFSFLVEEKVK